MSTSSQDTLVVAIPANNSIENIGKFSDEIDQLLRNKPRTLEIDTSKLVNVTSSHVGIIWQAYLKCADAGVVFKLKKPSPLLVRVLKILDLDTILSEDQNLAGPYIRQAALNHTRGQADPYVDEFRACAEAVDKAAEVYVEFLRQNSGLSEIVRHELRTVFYEIATNIRSHAGLDEQETIVFTFTMNKNKALMVFVDSGNPFDPTKYRNGEDLSSAMKAGRIRGFGIPMLIRMTDSITYNRLNDMLNIVTVQKSWE